MDIQPIAGAPQTPAPNYPWDYDPQLNGLGGWLVLVIIGRFLTVIIAIKDIADLSSVIGYDRDIDGLLRFGILFDVAVLIFMSAAILYFMFSRKIVFRTLFVVQSVAIFLFNLISYLIMASHGYDMGPNMIASPIVVGLIWIIYLYKSKRVKNTFIYPYSQLEMTPNL